jgi:hypothetical protein
MVLCAHYINMRSFPGSVLLILTKQAIFNILEHCPQLVKLRKFIQAKYEASYIISRRRL